MELPMLIFQQFDSKESKEKTSAELSAVQLYIQKNDKYQSELEGIKLKYSEGNLRKVKSRGPLITFESEIPSTSVVVECTKGKWMVTLTFRKKEWIDNTQRELVELLKYYQEDPGIYNSLYSSYSHTEADTEVTNDMELLMSLMQIEDFKDEESLTKAKQWKFDKEFECLLGKTVVFKPRCNNWEEGAEQVHDFLLQFTAGPWSCWQLLLTCKLNAPSDILDKGLLLADTPGLVAENQLIWKYRGRERCYR
jgi:hypothetical protein